MYYSTVLVVPHTNRHKNKHNAQNKTIITILL